MQVNKKLFDKTLKATQEAKEYALMMQAFCNWQAEREEDEKVAADWRVKADTYDATIQEKDNSIEAFLEFEKSFTLIPSPFK